MSLPTKSQRFESGLIFLVSGSYYFLTGGNWVLFFLTLFVPDVSLAGYLVNPRIGVLIYNFGHSYILPMGLLLTNWLSPQPFLSALSLVWICHISMDRALGFGLKAATSFQETHLGKIGKR